MLVGRYRVIMQTEELEAVDHQGAGRSEGNDISVIDVKDRTSVTDYMVIASGTSSRHVASLADNVITEAKNGVRPLGSEGETGSDWILVDLVKWSFMSCCRAERVYDLGAILA